MKSREIFKLDTRVLLEEDWRLMSKALFYQGHLDEVSRSFAFCIARLPSPLREQVGLAYLLCRVLDCVEDASWPDVTKQHSHFNKFIDFITTRPLAAEVEAWVREFPVGLPASEIKLFNDSPALFKDFHDMAAPVRDALYNPILSMARGMAHFTDRKSAQGELRLASLRELNQYCFFVAGVVGEILTSLVKLQNVTLNDDELENAIHFGFFLQKINILKDQLDDEGQGRFFIPSRELVKRSLEQHANQALQYITALPERLSDFRLFCSWSLFLGLASLPWIEESWRNKKAIKIPRLQTQALLWEIEKKVNSNAALRELFKKLEAKAQLPLGETLDAKQVVDENSQDLELKKLYSGELSDKQLSNLGILGAL